MNDNIDEKNQLVEKIEKLKTDFYTENNKNIFFKKKQKMECANSISQQIDLEQLLNYTFCFIPNSNKIHIDYNIFKTYAHTDIFQIIVNKLIEVLNIYKNKYGCFEIYVNLDTVTISAFERYKELLLLFSKICNEDGLKYTEFLNRCVIYNSPNFIEHIKTIIYPMLTKKTCEIIEFYNKNHSDEIKKHVFNSI